MKLSKKQIIAVVAAVLLIVLLILSPRKVLDKQLDKKQEVEQDHNHPVQTIVMLEDSMLGALDASQRGFVDGIYQQLESAAGTDKSQWHDSLSIIWKDLGSLALAAHYAERAVLEGTAVPNDWLLVGDAYFSAYRYDMNAQKDQMIRNAISAYERALDGDSTLMKAQTSLGVCLVEGARYLNQPPMKGITLLKDVLKKDPKNIDAMVNLGYFAIQSGQFDKAIERFNKVVELDPGYAEASLYLADIYLNKSDTTMAIEHLERYKELTEDSLLAKQVNDYIKDLKNI